MRKDDYLARLRVRLAQMDGEEREAQLAYYEELFQDMAEDGLSEEEIVARLGTPEVVAEELLAQMPMAELVKSRVRPRGGWTALTVVLLILGAPLWIPLVFTSLVLVGSFFLVLFSLVLALVVTVLALALGAVTLPFAVLFGGSAMPLLLALGFGLIGLGALPFAALFIAWVCRGLRKLCVAAWRKIKSWFIRRS